jgi:hypothetical protein
MLLRTLCHANSRLECFHAAAVAKGSYGAMLVGKSNAGKSTLALAFCSEGWNLINDDISLVDLPTGRLLPVQRSLTVRADLPDFPLSPYTDVCPVHEELQFWDPEFTSREVRYPKAKFIAEQPSYKITDVVFLDRFSARPVINRLSTVAGAMRLSKASFHPLIDAGSRLESYLEGFRSARWWTCEIGRPFDTVAKICSALTLRASGLVRNGTA